MTGSEYRDAVAAYVAEKFGPRGVHVYTEVKIGKTVVGKRRGVDVFVVDERTERGDALAIECKYQDAQGTADEKIPFALENLSALSMPGVLVYGGRGFSAGILHMLEASPRAARFQPPDCWQLDHALATTFRWWDLLLKKKRAL